ncbi:hypothetical protein QQS21_008635 [Conoideocrella luteorostrata]|uniref:DUF7924 domain-containing protein n=1 Tax=Conoideocrella luteorostrata TaxID=1105319 RepID=A0AAJ0FR19_9HYPO|nr:hypothetical protein QQS21_008635 [Conoideocrella luteorostrata]
MALTRAQQAHQRGLVSSVSEESGLRFNRRRATSSPTGTSKQTAGIGKPRTHQTRPRNQQSRRRTAHTHLPLPNVKDSVTPRNQGMKPCIHAFDHELDHEPVAAPERQRRRRRSSIRFPVQEQRANPAKRRKLSDEPPNPIGYWAREGHWPREYYQPDMQHLLARKKSLSSLGRKRSNSATSATPSDQRPREEKSAPYRDARYKTVLATKESFMYESDLGINKESKDECVALATSDQSTPENSLFRDDLFQRTCRKVEDRNEARVLRDITPLIVPSAENLCIYGAEHLGILIESLNEGWNNSIPLAGSRPQPDYSVGFNREAFTNDQLAKLSPFIGDFIFGDHSFFMATYYMYFPFLTCEVKCGAAALDVADRQNAHSMTLAVRAVVELFRAVKRENELHRQVLAFSVSHDHRSVRIYGHYPVMDGNTTKYYRHPIREFSFTELDGKEKWTAYRFTKSVYESWVPSHFKTLCSAIDQLPAHLNFDDPSPASTGLSQSLASHHLSQSEVSSISLPAEQDDPSGSAIHCRVTPNTSFTDKGAAKKRKGRK